MAIVTGDEFVLPITLKDGITGKLKNIGASVVVFNQALELARKGLSFFQSSLDSTVGKAIALEKQVAEISTLLAGDASNATAQLTEEILKLQSTFGTSQADLAKAYYQAISSGAVSAETAQTLLTAAQKLAIGGVTDLGTATDGLTTIINAYGLNADEATNVSDALFLGMRAGKTTIGELSQSLGQVAGLANTTGVSFNELVASVSAVTTGGIQTSIAVTQIRAALVGLTKQTPKLTSILDDLGATSIKTKLSQDGLVQTLKDIIGQTDGSAESLSELFGSIEAVNAVVALTSNSIGGKFTNIMKDMGAAATNAGAVTEEAFNKLSNTTDFRLSVLQGKVIARMTKIGQMLKPIFATLLETFIETFDKVFGFIESLADIDFIPFIKAFGTIAVALRIFNTETLLAIKRSALFGISLLKNAEAMVIYNGGILQTIKLMSALIVRQARTIALFTLSQIKVVLLTSAIIGAISAIEIIVNNFDLLKNAAIEIFSKIYDEFARITGIDKFFEIAVSKIKSVFNSVFTFIINGWTNITTFISNIATNIANFFSPIGTFVNNVFDGIFKFVKDVFTKIINFIRQVVSKILEFFNPVILILKKVGAIAGDFTVKGFDFLKKSAEITGEVVSKTFEKIDIDGTVTGDVIKNATKLLDKFKDSKDSIIDGKDLDLKIPKKSEPNSEAPSGTSSVQVKLFNPEDIKLIQAGLGKTVADMSKVLSNSLTGFTTPIAAANIVVDAVQGLIDSIPQLLSKIANVFNTLTELPIKIVEGISNVISSIGNLLANFVPNLAKAIPKIFSQLFIELPKAISAGAMSLLNALPQIVTGLINSIPELINGFVKGSGQIAIKMVTFLVKDAPKIALALTKALIIDLPIALADGIIAALKSLGGELSNLFKGIFPVADIQNGISEISDKIARSTSQLFKVVDLEQASRGLDIADKIRSAISSGAGNLKKALSKNSFLKDVIKAIGLWSIGVKLAGIAWNAAVTAAGVIWDAIVAAGAVIWETIQTVAGVIWNAIVTAGAAIWETVQVVAGAIWNAIVTAGATAWKLVQTTAGTIWNGLVTAGTVIWETVQTTAGAIWNGLVTAGAVIWETVQTTAGVIWEAIVAASAIAWETVVSTSGLLWNLLLETGAAAWSLIVLATSTTAGILLTGGLVLILAALVAFFSKGGNVDKAKEFFNGLGGKVSEGFKGVVDFFKGLPKMLMDGLNALNPINLLNKLFPNIPESKGFLEEKLGFDVPVIKFSEGGKVPGNPVVAGDSPLNDRILSLLSPGEIVLSRSEVKRLEELLGGQIPGFFKGFKKPKFVENIQEGAAGAVSGATKSIQNITAKIATGNIKEALSELDPTNNEQVKAVFEGLKDVVKNFADLFEKFKDRISSESVNGVGKLATLGLATGGYVDIPQGKVVNSVLNAQTGAFAQGTDTIKANLTPGEFVVNREATRNNLGLLSFMNSTKKPVNVGGSGSNVTNVTINAKTMLTPEQIKSEIVPTLERELKRKSQQGRFVLASQGIRS